MRPKVRKSTFHISWFSNVRKMDLHDRRQKREWIQMVLTRGLARDVRKLNIKEVRDFLPELHLPPETRRLWENYFASRSK